MTWEVTKPTLAVATESYTHLYNLHRAHPDDVELFNAKECAYSLMVELWNEHEAARKAAL